MAEAGYFINRGNAPFVRSKHSYAIRPRSTHNVLEIEKWIRPRSHIDRDVLREFRALADQWREATEFSSVMREKITNPFYLEIISLGDAVIPILLQEIQRDPGHWFTALKAVAKCASKQFDPVAPEDRNDFDKVLDSWLEWGRKEGYISDDRDRNRPLKASTAIPEAAKLR